MSRPGLLLLTSLALLLAACDAPTEVEFGGPRTVASERRPTTWDAPARDRLGLREMDAPSDREAAVPQQSWTGTTPDGWEELPPQPRRFRELLWRVAGTQETECYLSVGVRGGVSSNMTRWYTEQFGIAEVPNAETLPAVEIAGRRGRLVELAGTFTGKPGMAVLLAFFVEGELVTSLKFTGPEATVKQNRAQFLEVARSLRLAPRVAAANPTRNAANNASGGEQRWTGTTPSGWEELPPQPGRFRELLWRVAGNQETECYLSAGVGGGVAMNMKRWYTEQNGIQDVPAMESLPVVEMAGRQGRLIELTAASGGKAMMIAFFADGPQLTTLKFTGPETVVKQNRAQFLDVAKSLRVATASNKEAPSIQPGQPMPSGHPAVPGGPGAAASAASPFTATVPSGWTAKTGSQRALHYTFGSDGEVYMSQLGGTLRPTLDIWRGEFELPAMSDSEFQGLPKVPMLGSEGTLLDVAGDFRSMTGKQIAGARVLVAALVEGSTITFVKLVGKAGEVETQRESLLQFLASLRRVP